MVDEWMGILRLYRNIFKIIEFIELWIIKCSFYFKFNLIISVVVYSVI